MRHDRIERREFLAAVAGTTTALAGRLRVHAQNAGGARAVASPAFMYVGSFTSEARGHGDGISVFARKPSGWALIQVLKELADPSFVIVNRARTHLYSAHGDGTEAVAYRIDEATGRLTILNRQPTGGKNGVHLAIDATGRFLALANYATGSLVVFPINADGSLGTVSDLAPTTGTPGPHKTEQQSSHPHHCPFDRSGRFMVVPDKGLDKVFVYRLDAANGKLIPGSPADVKARAGAAPRHVDFHPAKPFAYVINELDSTITTYAFDPQNGVLDPREIHTTLPPSYTGNNTGAEIAVAPSGRFVYGSNRGHDSIAIFAIDPSTSLLTPIGWEPTRGRTPRFFALDPSGDHLYAANQTSDTVVIFDVDQTTGKLKATGEILNVLSPCTIAFR